MNGWIVKSTLTDTIGEIVDTLAQGIPAQDAVDLIESKVQQYADSYWTLTGRGPRVANFTHSESGARLSIVCEFGALAVATRF